MRRGCPVPPFRLVISMRTHVVSSWSVPACTSRLTQPQIPCPEFFFSFFFTPPSHRLLYVLFKNDCTDPAPHSLISCTCIKGRQDWEGTACTKREGHRDTRSRRAHSHPFIRCALGSERHRAQVHFSSAAVRTGPDWVELPSVDMDPDSSTVFLPFVLE